MKTVEHRDKADANVSKVMGGGGYWIDLPVLGGKNGHKVGCVLLVVLIVAVVKLLGG